MISAMPVSPAWFQPAILIGLDVAAKSLLLLALGFAATALLTRKQLLTRSALWNACVLGLLILPISSVALPRLRIPVLPATPVASLAPEPTVAPIDETMVATESRILEPAIPEPSPSVATESAPPPPLLKPPNKINWVLVAILAYAGGTALLALRLVLALLDVRRLRRSAQAVYDPLWRDTLKSWLGRLGIPTPVQLLHSPRVSVPVAFGWLRPAVVIPADMVEAPISARRSCILLHELAHVRRRDYLWQLLLKCAQVLYWPNPLIWFAGRLIAANREEATDALCAYHATNANEYRLTLLEVAQSLVRRPAAALGIAMARTPRIAQRLERIDRGVRLPNCLAGRTTRTIVAVTALVVAGVVGASQLASRSLGHDSAKRSESMARIKQIAIDFLLDDPLSSLQDLVDKKAITKEMLISPVTPSATQPSYVHVPWRGKQHSDPRNVLLYEHPANYQHRGTIVCYGDAHVEWHDLAGFQKTLAATFERMNRPVPTEHTQEAIDAAVGPAPARTRYFVLLVVGKDKLTFEGRPTTWEELPKLLEQVPNRPSTVFATAVATDEMTIREQNNASSRASAIGREFDFEYLSDVGVKPLGSKGDPPQQVPAPTARPETPRTPSTAPAATPTTTQPTPRVRLKSGAEVELLGIRALGDENAWWAQKWWGLDGRPLEVAPCDDSEARFSPDQPVGWAAAHKVRLKDTREYLFAARINGSHSTQESPELPPMYTWRAKGASFTTGEEMKRDGRSVPACRVLHAAIRTGQGDTTQIRIGIGTGTWETRGVSNGEASTASKDGITVAFSAAQEEHGVTTVFVTCGERERAQRVLAIDHNGRTYINKADRIEGAGESRKIVATFPRLPLKQIKEFQFQMMDYEWATFDNVPLHPGHFVAPGKAVVPGAPRDTLSKETTPKGMMGLMAPSSPPSGAKQPPARNVTQATGPKVTLKSGAAVEFLGVHLLPEKDGWWGLDGQPLEDEPCDPGEPRYWDVKKKENKVIYPPDVREYQFVLRVTGPEGKEEVFPNLIPWVNEVPGAKSSYASASVTREGQAMFGYRSIQATLPTKQQTAGLLIGLVAGNWKTQGTSDGNLGGTSGQGSDVLFSAGAEIQGNATISVTNNKSDNATRIIAIDGNGETHETPGISSVSGEKSRVTQAIFPNLALREVKEFQFQTCEYEWVSFSGIPLPGPHNTRASASDKPAEKQPAAVSAKQVVQIGGHIARPGVYALPAETKLTVLQLIASAGGTNIDPGEAVVRIQRVDRRNHNLPLVIEGNPLSRFLADPQRDLALQADDVVQILTMKEAEQKPTGAATLPAPDVHGTKTIEKDPAARAGTVSKHAIIERTINADAIGKDCAIDLDSGRLATPDKSFSGSFPGWFKTSGVDAACTTESAGAGLYGFDMVVAPVAGEAWDKYSQEPFASLVHHVQAGTPGTPAVMSAAGQLPATYLFKTREGGTGVLQILELSNKPDARFLRIRYRMLSAPAGSAGRPAADSGKAPTTTRPAQGEITGLAIVVPRRDSIEQPSGLSPDKKDQYVAELAAHGPDSTSKSGSEYRWFELGNGVSHELGLEGTYDGQKYLLVDARPANAMFTSQGEGSWSITKAAITKDRMGRPAITYSLDDRGAKLLSVLSRNNIGHPAALIAGSRVVTIAVIRSEISKTVQISGNYTETEWRRILAELPVASTAPASEDAAATKSAQH